MTYTTTEKSIHHPLEDEFEIEPGTTLVTGREMALVPDVIAPDYDDKDQVIEEKLEEIYTLAMESAQVMTDESERVEGKYKARVGEVSAAMLNVALGAVREKSSLKMHKDKMTAHTKAKASGTVNNNLVVASQSEILQLLASANVKK